MWDLGWSISLFCGNINELVMVGFCGLFEWVSNSFADQKFKLSDYVVGWNCCLKRKCEYWMGNFGKTFLLNVLGVVNI